MKRVVKQTMLRSINVQASSPETIVTAQNDIIALLRQRHRTSEQTDDFTVRNQQEIAQAATATTDTMTVLLGFIAGVSLIVGGIGIMNIMLVSVTERTREIGIRMAVGAHGSEIQLQFLTESVVFEAFGGTCRHGFRFSKSSIPPPNAHDRFVALLRASVHDGTLAKLTLGKYRGSDDTLRNLFVRPVTLKSGSHLTLVWRHATRDITKNFRPTEALALLEPLIGRDFLDAHLFTPLQTAQLECTTEGTSRLRLKTADTARRRSPRGHDREGSPDPAETPWLHTLGVTNEQGRPRRRTGGQICQINKFVELLVPLLAEAGFDGDGR